MSSIGALPSRSFQRIYKACDNCRQKKKRCDLVGDRQGSGLYSSYGSAGPPCASCRRERRQCVFREARDTKKRNYVRSTRRVTRASASASAQNERSRNLSLSASGPPSRSERRPQSASLALAPDTNLADLTTTTTSPPLLLLEGSSLDTAQDAAYSHLGTAGVEDAATEETVARSAARPPQPGLFLHGDPHTLSDRSSRLVTETTILKGNDAIDILLEAATEQGSSSLASPAPSQPPSPRVGDDIVSQPSVRLEHLGSEPNVLSPQTKKPCLKLIKSSSVHPTITSAWESSLFVRTGLLSTDHAITLVEGFFANLAPFSLVATRHQFHQSNRNLLLLQEPLLCTAILLISSRHHLVPAAASEARQSFLHDELWEYAHRLIQRIMLGQGQGLRSIASIEALLLLAEWYPAPLNARPSWVHMEEDETLTFASGSSQGSSRHKITSTAQVLKQQDQTRWMLLGAAHSLGHEVGIFGGGNPDAGSDIAPLLLAHITVLAARLGLHTIIPLTFSRGFLGQTIMTGDKALEAWVEFLRLTKSIHEQLLSNEAKAKEVVSGGQYTVLAAFFKSGLEDWYDMYLSRIESQQGGGAGGTIPDSHRDILSLEYHCVKLWINGLSLQAISSPHRSNDVVFPLGQNAMRAESPSAAAATNAVAMELQPEFPLIQEVVEEAQHIVSKAIEWSVAGKLRFHPCRTFYRISSACVFVVKVILLGVHMRHHASGQGVSSSHHQIDLSILCDLLQQCAEALKASASDECHPASHFSRFIRLLLQKLRPLVQKMDDTNQDALGPNADFDWNFEQWPNDLIDSLLQLDPMPEMGSFAETT